MADSKITGLLAETAPASDAIIPIIKTPDTEPLNRKSTLANVITKGHGLSNGMIEVASGVMGVATAGTDYTSPSSTETFTNKTYDTAGTGNSLSINGVAATANTGTGAVVRETSPTLVTPILGVAAATTVNKVALTAPATGSTLTIADGQTLTVNGSATITNGTHSGTNTGDQTIPSVATGTELDTGTDNDKIATALALKNSHNVPSVAPSTSGNLLQSNGTDWVSNTVAFGKQMFQAIVDAAGNGDYTTVRAAVAAGATRIFVRNGSYSETLSTSAVTASTHIVGESPTGVILTMGYGISITLSGEHSRISNMKIVTSSSTYALNLNGNYCRADNVYITSSNNRVIQVLGSYCVTENCFFEGTSNASGGYLWGNAYSGVQQRVINCRFKSNSGNTGPCLLVQTPDSLFIGCTFDVTNGNSGAQNFMQVSDTTTIVGNTFRSNQVAGQTALVISGTNNTVVGNSFIGFVTQITDTATATTMYANSGVNVTMEKRYVYMKNTSGATINAGNVVTLKAVAAGNEVTTTTTASDNLVFGVAAAAISNNASGYIQVVGKTTLLTVDGTTDIAVGDYLTTFTTAGIAKKAAPAALGVSLGDLAFAVALEAYTTDNSSGVIDALIINPIRL